MYAAEYPMRSSDFSIITISKCAINNHCGKYISSLSKFTLQTLYGYCTYTKGTKADCYDF